MRSTWRHEQSVSHSIAEMKMPAAQSGPYGSWSSPITSDLIAAGSINLVDVMLDGGDVYWVEGRPQESGRYVIVRTGRDGTLVDQLPSPFYARTRVHEYGGSSAIVSNGVIYFSHFSDQRLYRLNPESAPVPLTPAPPDDAPSHGLRYADGQLDTARKLWIGIREDHLDSARGEVINTVVAVDAVAGGHGTVLVSGNDFYSSPRLSPNGRKLAWLTWNHPNMPWTGTELWVGDFDGKAVTNSRKVAGGAKESVFQPEWAA